jgi:hypothetical protein
VHMVRRHHHNVVIDVVICLVGRHCEREHA